MNEELEKEINEQEEVWECDVCGYVHHGKLPKDYNCPMCGVDVNGFKKIESNN